jgi:hypothetical protein
MNSIGNYPSSSSDTTITLGGLVQNCTDQVDLPHEPPPVLRKHLCRWMSSSNNFTNTTNTPPYRHHHHHRPPSPRAASSAGHWTMTTTSAGDRLASSSSQRLPRRPNNQLRDNDSVDDTRWSSGCSSSSAAVSSSQPVCKPRRPSLDNDTTTAVPAKSLSVWHHVVRSDSLVVLAIQEQGFTQLLPPFTSSWASMA